MWTPVYKKCEQTTCMLQTSHKRDDSNKLHASFQEQLGPKQQGTSLLMNVPLAVMMAAAERQIELQVITADM